MDTPILVPRHRSAPMLPSLIEEPWGPPNVRRGLSSGEPQPPVLPNDQLAVEFRRKFPLKTVLTMKQLDIWAESQGVYTVPAIRDPQSDACLALTQRRHQLRKKLNSAGIHPRMNPPEGPGTFYLDVRANKSRAERDERDPYANEHSYVVRAPLEKVTNNDVAPRIASFITNHRRLLRYLFQSQDWTSDKITPEQKRAAQTLYSLTDNFEDNMRSIGKNYHRQYKLWAALLGEIASMEIGFRDLLEQGSSELI